MSFNRLNFLSLGIIYILVLSLLALGSCRSIEDPSTETESITGGKERPIPKDERPVGNGPGQTQSLSLSETLVTQMEKDLVDAGLSEEQVQVIGKSARDQVVSDQLEGSLDLEEVIASVLKGAEVSVADPDAKISSSSDKINTIKIMIDSLTGSMNGRVADDPQAKRFSITSWFSNPKALYRSSGEKYDRIFGVITRVLVENLDDAGIEESVRSTAVKKLLGAVVANLSSAGVAKPDMQTTAETIAKSAVGALGSAGIAKVDYANAVKSVVSGIVTGLAGNGLDSEEITDVTATVVKGAVMGLQDAGVDLIEIDNYVSLIKEGASEGLSEAGLTQDEIDAVSTQMDDATSEAVTELESNQEKGFKVTPISGDTTESGGTATFTVKLLTQPRAEVSLSVFSSNLSEGTVDPESLIFTTDNWNAEQTVTVTGVDDDLADGAVEYSILLGTAVSEDAGYDGITPVNVTLFNIDDDTAGITVSEITGATSENGTTASFTVRLNSQPTADVEIAVTSNDTTEVTVDPETLIFTSENWNAEQTVTVTGIDDTELDGDVTFAIELSAAISDDTGYDGLDPVDVTVVNSDNDDAGFVVSAPSGDTIEDGTSASFTVKLDSQPTFDVSISLVSLDETEGTISPESLTFTSENWNAAQAVTVTGVDDDLADGNQNFTIQLGAATSEDLDYDGINPTDVIVTNLDNDTAGFLVSAISGDTAESGTTASFSVRLTSQPTADVVIDVVSLDLGEGTVSPASLTFTSDNWNAVDHFVTVTGIDDDLADGNQSFTIQLGAASSSDPNYDTLNPADVTVTNTDDDSAGFTVSTISGNTSEAGGTATFTVQLTSQPTADVTISVASLDTGEGTVSPASLTLTSENWNATNHTVTVTGVDDYVQDGDQSFTIQLGAASSSDPNYDTLNPSDVTVTNTDDDSAGFTVSAISGNTTEAGGTATFTVQLTSQPTADVVISVSSLDTGEGTVSPASLTLTSANWNATNHTVTVTGVDDDSIDGDQSFTIQLGAAVSGDGNYDSMNPTDVTVTNTDDDSAGFTISAISGDTTEAGGTATFTVQLTSQPTADVVIDVVSLDLGEGTVSPASLTFTSDNWNAVDHLVTVTGIDDDLADGNQSFTIQLGAASSSDPDYDTLNPSDVTVTNTDDDSAGFTVSTISGNTTEAGGTATFTVQLTSQPTADVVISVSSLDTGEGTVSPASLTLTSANWNATNHTVTITGADDYVQDGDQSFTIQLGAASSSDPDYDTLNPSDVTVTNTDDDSAGFTVSAISGNTTEAGGTATFTVQLTSQPTNDVTINVTSLDTGEGTVSPASLTFTSVNWNATNHTVTVTGVDDYVQDGDQSFTVELAAASSSDPDYDTLNPSDVTVTNTDDDSAGFTISAISGNTSEAGGTATFTVQLTSQPTADVTISVSSLDTGEGTVSPASLTLTSANWNASSHIVTVTGVDDDSIDGDQSFTIQLGAASSSDANYDTLNPSDVTVTNTDDDSAGINITTTDSVSGEDGTTASFYITLTSQPTDSVTIGLTSTNTAEGTVAASITIQPADWDALTNIVTVTGVDDFVADGSQSYSITTAAATSNDLNYDGINPSDVSLTNTDNDSAGFTISAISGNTTEAGGTATFTVQLTSQPTADVVISVSSLDTGEGTVSPASLTLTSANWNASSHIVTVTGVDDSIVDGSQSFTVQLGAASSSDPDYDTLNPADVTATNIDDDSLAMTSFQFLMTDNSCLSSDITADIAGTSITADIPGVCDASSMVASFSTNAASVTVSSVEQTSGTTTNDFTSQVSYLITAHDASTQTYNVNASWGFAQEAYLKAPNAEVFDYFGWSVSISGDTVVVGARDEDSNQTTITNGTSASADNSATSAGAAYVFVRNGTTWSQQAYLKAPNAEGGDQFGYAVAIDGDTIVVGSSLEGSNQTTITNGSTASANNSLNHAGAAYVFVRNGSTWSQQAYLKAPNVGASDQFGQFVTISGDTIVVGAPWEDSNQTTITNGTSASADNSATSAGAAYVFVRNGTTWSQQAYLKAPNAEGGDNLGRGLSISGDTIVLGAPYDDSNQTTITNGSTASADNSVTDAGSAFVFVRNGSTWSQQAYLKAPNADSNDYFGFSVGISGDTIVVGAYFESSSQTTITNGPTASADNSAYPAGAAYVFVRNGTAWTQQAYLKAPNTGSGDYVGISVAIDGNTLVAGAYGEDSNQTSITNGAQASADNSATYAGAAYVFVRNGSTWSQHAYLKAPNAEANDEFGRNVSISGDSIVVGAWQEESNQTTITNGTTASADNSASDAGAAYIFR